MGLMFSKNGGLQFTILPSNDVSGPLGLGDPASEELNSVELETIIPALMNDRLRVQECLEPWDKWTVCSQKYRRVASIFCHRVFFEALKCNKDHIADPEFFEEMKRLYLEMRSDYRRTGVEKRVVCSSYYVSRCAHVSDEEFTDV
ncbi:hypothetical protein X801_00558 [Opisthorchis viverrini]|uniref:COX assembly mitochondrial protein n=1 Tax=Opisthorchis viverrini TaxID=6198 RepID=A0A1S8X9Z5_OPIVI|nr:hypothetical protein X801_00558 [Opisthorchis viverrini]